MLAPSPEALDFLLTRRSHPARTLGLPVPDREALMPLLTAAARSPDHGKLVPWRFIVLDRTALARLSAAVPGCDAAADLDEKAIAKAQQQFDESHLAVAVIEVQRPSPKIPAIEQSYSAGAACLGLLNAALAAGWGANWLTGWPSHDRSFVQEALGLDPAERVVGFVHIGTATAAPSDRPRPDVEALTTWAGDA
jgi:nitroreductase